MGGGRQSRIAATLLLGLFLASPTSIAEAVRGTLSFAGELTIPADSEMSAIPLAVFAKATEDINALEIRANAARITVYETRFVLVDAIEPLPVQIEKPGGSSVKSWVANNVHATLAPDGDHTGILGVHPSETASLTETTLAETVV